MTTTTTTGEAPVRIKFTAEALPPVAMFMAKSDIRFYLMGVCVQPHPLQPGVLISATDGHRLAVWYDASGECSATTILRISPELISACKRRIRLSSLPSFASNGFAITIEDGRLILSSYLEDNVTKYEELFIQPGNNIIDGKFPDIWRVIPKEHELVDGLRGCMQGCYLADLAKAAALLGGGSGRFKAFNMPPRHFTRGEDGTGSIVTRFGTHSEFMVITMPIRAEFLPNKLISGLERRPVVVS